MLKIFILSKKQELKPYILVGIFLGMTNLSEMINFSIVITMKIFFISDLVIFFYHNAGYLNRLAVVFILINASNILTCFKNF